MSLPLHLVWLGGAVPLRGLENLHRLARLHAQEAAAAAQADPQDRPYFPLLWLDRSAWDRTLAAPVTPVAPVDPSAVPAALRQVVDAGLGPQVMDAGLGPQAPVVRWLRLDAAPQAEPEAVLLPVLIYEDMQPALAAAWQQTDAAWTHLRALARTPAGRDFLAREPRLPELLQAAGAGDSGPDFAAWLELLIDHVRARWSGHGLLCLASDLLRLQALVWRPGAYADLGDIAALLRVLPTRRRTRAAQSPFCAHCTIAIENDLIFCADRARVQAVTIGTVLWGVRALEAVAARLKLPPRPLSAPDLARAVLPALDAQMPPAPPLRPLYETPHAGLADYVNRAYGSHPLGVDPQAPQAFFSGRDTKDGLINQVGGFTGYQLFARVLAPACRAAWEEAESDFGLRDYAPQLGWKTHGFGTLERLVGHGQRLRHGHPRLASVQRELQAMAAGLELAPQAMEPLARRVSEVHDLLRQAHYEPARREALIARAIARSRQP